jgi:hypothetical protein
MDISKADFFALAASVAVERGLRISNEQRTDGKRFVKLDLMD